MTEPQDSAARLVLTIPGEPRSKARPRFTGNGKVYSDKTQRGHEELLEWHFRLACPSPLKAGVGVGVTFYRSNLHRIDLDNLVKAVLDAANGIAWVDDVQVVELAAALELDRENPRTIVAIEERSTTMPRGTEARETRVCPTCEGSFESRSYASKPDGQIYCSKACIGTAPLDCPTCGARFKPRGPQQRFCGKACSARSTATKRKIAAKRRRADLPSCLMCGQELHRKGAILCRPCWLKEAPKGKTKEQIIEALTENGHIQPRRHRVASVTS